MPVLKLAEELGAAGAVCARLAEVASWSRPEVEGDTAMHETTPRVFLIARPSINVTGMRAYLDDVGGGSWLDRRLEDPDVEPNPAEALVEFGGRLCYRSWEPELNPNVKRVRTDPRAYFENILAPALDALREECVEIVERLEEFQVAAAEQLELDADGIPFSVKKEVTSALRRLAPIGLSTDILMTMNVRTLRHVIEMRTSVHAEEELRLIFDQIGKIMQKEAPLLFQDFKCLDDGSWVPEHRKV